MLHQTQAQAQRRPAIGPPFERTVPMAACRIDCTHLHTVRARIAHQLRRRVETHRLAIDESRAKCRRLVVLQPGGGVREQCKARRVRLRKAIITEAAYLVEYLLRKTFGISPSAHAVDQLPL